MKIEVISNSKHSLELIIADDNSFPTTKNCLSFQNYPVCDRVVV